MYCILTHSSPKKRIAWRHLRELESESLPEGRSSPCGWRPPKCASAAELRHLLRSRCRKIRSGSERGRVVTEENSILGTRQCFPSRPRAAFPSLRWQGGCTRMVVVPGCRGSRSGGAGSPTAPMAPTHPNLGQGALRRTWARESRHTVR